MLRILLAAGVAGLVSIGLGAVQYGAWAARAGLEDLLEAASPAGAPWRLDERWRQDGLMRTRGRVALALEGACLAQGRLAGPAGSEALMVHYEIDHRPGLDGPARFTASLVFAGAPGAESDAGAPGALLTLRGHADYRGRVLATFASPGAPTGGAAATPAWRIAPSRGRVERHADGSIELDWRLPSLAMRAGGASVELEGLHLRAQFADPAAGPDRQVLDIAQARVAGPDAAPGAVLEGLRIEQTQRIAHGRLASVTTPSLARLSWDGRAVEDLGMRLALDGIDSAALRRAWRSLADGCGPDAQAQLEDALFGVLEHGLSLRVDDVRARRGTDFLEARLLATLHPRADETPTLFERSEIALNARISEALPDAGAAARLDASGLARLDSGLWRADVALRNGRLRTDGRPGPKSVEFQARRLLANGERALAAWREERPMLESPLAVLDHSRWGGWLTPGGVRSATAATTAQTIGSSASQRSAGTELPR